MVANKIGYVVWPRAGSMRELSRNCVLLFIAIHGLNASSQNRGFVGASRIMPFPVDVSNLLQHSINFTYFHIHVQCIEHKCTR